MAKKRRIGKKAKGILVFLWLGIFVCGTFLAVDIWKQSRPDSATSSLLEYSSNFAPADSLSQLPAMPVDNSAEVSLPFSYEAQSVYLYDLNREEMVYAKNPTEKRAPASLTKVMTAIVAMESTSDLKSRILTYQSEMKEELLHYGLAEKDIATFDFYDGEQMTMQDVLYILLLRSANDAANLIAEEVGGGSVADFVEKMNQKARDIGANDTHFMNPHGLDEEGAYTSAYDLYLITRYAMELPGFMDIVSSSYYVLPANHLRPSVEIETYLWIQDPAFSRSPFYFPYVKGVKTGYTDWAGKCLISTAEKDGERYLLVLMGVPEKTAAGEKIEYSRFFTETKAFYEWAFSSRGNG